MTQPTSTRFRSQPGENSIPGVHGAFSAVAAMRPDSVALTDGESSWTYARLEEHGNRVANALISSGVEPGDFVGVCAERSYLIVVGILGALKAGACYIPLDPDYPASRLEFLVGDSRPKAILAQEAVLDIVPGGGGSPLLTLDSIVEDGGFPGTNPGLDVSPGDLAYVIYTSGSTGTPKGVEVTHQNVLRLFSTTAAWFRFGHEDVWTLFHSSSFDFSVWEIWGALLFGGRLVIVPHLVSRSPRDFRQLLKEENVTVLNQTPSAFLQLMAHDVQEEDSLSLRYVIFGGEALKFGSLQPWVDKYGDEAPELINMYGITETTVHVTYRRVLSDDIRSDGGSFIGIPIPDLDLFVLDRAGEPVARGIPGELFVGGSGVARGYLGRPGLTAERFLANPFGPGRLYRTGDKVRMGEDGDLEYLGRLDNQVQLRGFRVELGEVEGCISRFPGVRDVVAVLREDRPGDPRLVAYCLPERSEEFEWADLDAFLRDQLPSHMVPNHLVGMDDFPLTAHGKVDREALPSPTPGSVPTEPQEARGAVDPAPEADPAPETKAPLGTVPAQEADSTGPSDLEELLVDVWAEVLGSPEVKSDSDFFLMGGHSLLAIQAMELVENELGREIPFRFIFQNPTPSTMASALEEWVVQRERKD